MASGPVLPDLTSAPAATWFDSMPIALLMAGEDGRVSSVNEAWTDLTTLSLAESRGLGWLDALADGADVQLLDMAKQAASVRATRSADVRISIGAERRWTRWWVRAHQIERGRVVAMAIADVDADYASRVELRHRAAHDALTGLLNRSEFFDRCVRALQSRRTPPAGTAVLFVDVDGLKDVNDVHGHLVGDRALRHVAQAIRQAVRAGDVAARVGGDEFAVLCDRLDHPADVLAIAARIRAMIGLPFFSDGTAYRVTASVGLAVAEPGEGPEAVLDRADHAMYRAKADASGHGDALQL